VKVFEDISLGACQGEIPKDSLLRQFAPPMYLLVWLKQLTKGSFN
jgi:hypothetical protein